MFDYKCPTCGIGTVRERRIKNYQTEIRGVRATIPEAIIGVCDKCESRAITRGEMKRWIGLVGGEMLANRLYMESGEICDLRRNLGLSVSEFARLLGTTRQSVHSWERLDRRGPQSRTIDVLLRLVAESLRIGDVPVLDFLAAQASALERITLGVSQKTPRRIPALGASALLPLESYEKNFVELGTVRDLPLLTERIQ